MSSRPYLSTPQPWLAWIAALLLSALQCAIAAVPPQEPRHALVVGNAGYTSAPLLNSVNDATAVAKVLEKAGFTVDLKLNATQKQLQDAVSVFGDRLKAGGAGLFYFAGHGVQIKGRNFLMPVGSDIKREDEVPYKAVDVQQVLDKMETAKNRINVVILDACRNNPMSSIALTADGRKIKYRGQAGLANVQAPPGTLLAFSTSPGNVADDQAGGANSLYTKHLLRHMSAPGVPLEQMFKRVRIDVLQESQQKQTPWEQGNLTVDYCFKLGPNGQCAGL